MVRLADLQAEWMLRVVSVGPATETRCTTRSRCVAVQRGRAFLGCRLRLISARRPPGWSAGPSPKGTREVRRVGITEPKSYFSDRVRALVQVIDSLATAVLVQYSLERDAQNAQVTLQGAEIHRQRGCDRRGCRPPKLDRAAQLAENGNPGFIRGGWRMLAVGWRCELDCGDRRQLASPHANLRSPRTRDERWSSRPFT